VLISSRFDVNDSQVRPIHESLIKSQYGGKESAYMLFYAQKKHIARFTTITPAVPPFWKVEIANQNEELEKA
jgi:hypothetical protein